LSDIGAAFSSADGAAPAAWQIRRGQITGRCDWHLVAHPRRPPAPYRGRDAGGKPAGLLVRIVSGASYTPL